MAHLSSRRKDFSGSERRVKEALKLYETLGFDRQERRGDLLSYLGVMCDRQKQRRDAEVYYQEALRSYRDANVTGDNVDITARNLQLNLKRQVRET